MKKWKIYSGHKDLPLMFRGKGGLIRPMRKDELVVSKIEAEVKHENGMITCGEVLGRKAWRIKGAGVGMVVDFVNQLNKGIISPLGVLERMEIVFEGVKSGKNKA